MSETLPVIYLARHGETAWTLSGQHTGLTDIPLTARGERNARRLQIRLRSLQFAKVLTSPLQRALRTCDLAGFGSLAELDPDLVEWNYGEYEGRITAGRHGLSSIHCRRRRALAGDPRASLREHGFSRDRTRQRLERELQAGRRYYQRTIEGTCSRYRHARRFDDRARGTATTLWGNGKQ